MKQFMTQIAASGMINGREFQLLRKELCLRENLTIVICNKTKIIYEIYVILINNV